ncbi:putative surface protein sp1 protein [Botrytis fragariae]|uniref:Putative surface protein sp1 protein n=1 Tax=Botrytis fragariae TaxID=1964551 RepID=A0A8H6EEI9_9HELO|nr:putative surface protein sp1 protein [Botrytis fragariae]KAF5869251.1 putative surface protein sp1 protein [Botrytis fragariae]
MHFQDIAFALFVTGAFAAPAALKSRDACSDTCNTEYNTCRSAPGANRSTCASNYASCLGYSPYDSNGSLVTPTACSSSVASTTASSATTSATADACVSKCNASYNSCRTGPNANQATCASEYSTCLGYLPYDSNGSLVTPTACSSVASSTTAAITTTTQAASSATTDACVSKCNNSYNSCRSAPDANMSTCASEYATCLGYLPFDNSGSLVTPTACSSSAVSTTNAPSSTQAPQASGTSSPDQTSIVEGAERTIKQLIRYCSEDGSGCDYNFAISYNDERSDERCTVIRMPGSGATTESWYGIPCTTGSANTISWGVSDQFGAENAFAVLTVTNNEEKTNAYFGVSNVNGNPVTPSSPAGSGNFGDIGPEPVYVF